MALNYPFPVDDTLTAVSIAYRNASLIANEVLPFTPVASREFRWLLHTREEGYTLPNDIVGRKSAPNQISFTATEQSSIAEDYALEDPIPQDDIETSNIAGIDPVGKSTEYLTNLLLLRHEKRVADLVFAPGTYPTGNKVALSGSSQYSDYAGSNPLSDMLTRLDAPLMRPNIMVIGQDAWRVLRQHPRIVEAVKGTGAGTNAQGTIVQQQLADLLEIEQIYVGQGRLNTANRGQTPTFARVWGKHIAFLYRDVLAGPQRGTTFGFTAQFGARIAGQIPDPDIGMRGGVKLRVGWSGRAVVSAPDLGYLIENAVA